MSRKWSYRKLPTLGHVALLWAERHGLNLCTADPAQAQRALEILLDAMPFAERIGAYGWPMTRRNWCGATGETDPRAHLRHAKRRDVWTHWLARQGVATGDLLSESEASVLEAALPAEAEPYLPLLGPYRRAWRWAKTPGIVAAPGYALLLQRTTDGRFLIDGIATIRWKPVRVAEYRPSERARLTVRDAEARRTARARFRPGQKAGQ